MIHVLKSMNWLKKKCKVKVILQQAEVAFGPTSHTRRPPLPQEKSLDLRAHGSIGESYGKKSPVTPLGIDPGTVRLVAQ